MSELVSITEASRVFNISRPRLSKLIKEFGIEKIKSGSSFRVNLDQLNQMFLDLKKVGRTRKKDIHCFEESDGGEADVSEALSVELEEKIEALQEEVDVIKEQLSRFIENEKNRPQPLGLKDFVRGMLRPWE